jgi:hypothetical protein
MNTSTIYCTSEQSLKGYQSMLIIKEHTAEVLVPFRSYLQLTELLDVSRTGESFGCP